MLNPAVLNAQTHAWLAQFDHRTIGPQEVVEITTVLQWTSNQLLSLAATSLDAHALYATVADIANAIRIYQQMGYEYEVCQRERFLYALHVQQQDAMAMLQAEMQTSARVERALQPPPAWPTAPYGSYPTNPYPCSPYAPQSPPWAGYSPLPSAPLPWQGYPPALPPPPSPSWLRAPDVA